MRFVCSFAWADLKVSQQERRRIGDLVRRLGLSAAEASQVAAWIEVPPPAEEVDPEQIPARHRQMFLEEAKAIIEADGVMAESERDTYRLLEQMIAT
jgi:hypothetical protein